MIYCCTLYSYSQWRVQPFSHLLYANSPPTLPPTPHLFSQPFLTHRPLSNLPHTPYHSPTNPFSIHPTYSPLTIHVDSSQSCASFPITNTNSPTHSYLLPPASYTLFTFFPHIHTLTPLLTLHWHPTPTHTPTSPPTHHPLPICTHTHYPPILTPTRLPTLLPTPSPWVP